MKIRKKDKVRVISGKDKGRDGTVEKVYQKSRKVFIPGINVFKRHLKKDPKTNQGGIVEFSRPLDISKVMLICPKCKKPTRLGFKIEKQKLRKKKLRYCKKCQEIID
ncbi:MAG: 50S ribosomal protein L24 [Patescibacteria group bacterium]|nr:50S ribosomal protein L24 [Patescibacteria group bacterium]